MQKLPEVEEAKAMFEDAKEWGVWRWLTEKRRARQTADAAWDALEKCEKKLKANWPPELRQAVREDEAIQAAKAKAHQAHLDAEARFDEADRRMSSSMACEGAQMAIDAWAMRERFIRKLETFARQQRAALE